MSTLKILTAKAFEPLLDAARYKAAYGGRGSGKSHFFGELLVETCQAERGTSAVCIREAQRTLAQSSKRLIESKIAALGLGQEFKIFSDKIETPGDGLIIFRGMQDHTADSIKSLEGFKIAWIDEAQSLSAHSLSLLRPTIRDAGSQLWASWNPYNIPLGGGLPFFGPTAPNSSFIFPFGQAISRTTYSTLFSLLSTTYGAGDGSTTFNIPDLRGRVLAGKDDMGGSAASRMTTGGGGIGGATLGAAGGNENQTLTLAQLPTGITSNGSNSISVTSTVGGIASGASRGDLITNGGANFFGAGSSTLPLSVGSVQSIGNNSISVTSTNTAGNAHTIMQPTIVCNYIMRII